MRSEASRVLCVGGRVKDIVVSKKEYEVTGKGSQTGRKEDGGRYVRIISVMREGVDNDRRRS